MKIKTFFLLPFFITIGWMMLGTSEVYAANSTSTIEFTSSSSSGDEAASPVLKLILSATSTLDITVDYSVTGGSATGGGVDFTLPSGTATISAGNSSSTIPIIIVNDELDEDNETIIVTISNTSNAVLGSITIHTYTIIDNDGIPTVQFTNTSSSGSETVSPGTIEISLSQASAKDVTINYSATGGSAIGGGTDYTLADGTATITAGNKTTNTTITIIDDNLSDDKETIIITISNPTNASLGSNTQHTFTIIDNEEAGVGVGGGGGGFFIQASTPLRPPLTGFGIIINNGASYTTHRVVSLTLGGGPDASRMAISEDPTFANVGQEPYQATKRVTLSEGEGEKTIYARFYSEFGQPSPPVSASIILTSADELDLEGVREGDVLREPTGIEVYVINQFGYKRNLFSPRIFSMYQHLKRENIKEVDQQTINFFGTSNLYRAKGDFKVYRIEEIDSAGDTVQRRWLNITPEQFTSLGFNWNQVFTINQAERGYYQEGSPLTFEELKKGN